MKCTRCQHESPAGQRFCGNCGARLGSSCSKCGAANPPGQRFCGECGTSLSVADVRQSATPDAYTPKHLAEKILTSRDSLGGERKQVTVLFADLKGSMELLADRDPEDARKLLDPVIEHMMEAVHRYEGTVNQVMGDGIMALFGAPLAHEDHAARACYAALRMQESVKRYAEGIFQRHGVPVEIRVGVNSGEVVVRAIGSDLRMDYTAVGQTTHLAARMEQMARPGTILLAPDTLALAEGLVQVTSRGIVPVKGLAAPIEIFELSGASPVRSRLHAAALRGLTRFVGRDAEIELLRRTLARASEGHGQVVAVVGEPGVGKSRLVWEFTHSHRSQGWLVLETASVSYGKATPYFPIIELLRSYFGIEPRDDDRKMREKVTGKLLSLDRALEATLPVFHSLLDVPVDDAQWTKLDPSQRKRQTLDALKRLLLRESQLQPVLLVVEDLHWIDSETQDWLDLLVESLPTARLLLLVNYRPEYGHGWGSKTYYQQVRLDTLPTASAEALLEGLLGTGLADLTRLLIDRTQGNPFFLEESVRALVETRALVGERGAYRLAGPVRTLQLPATAQAILAARIDRLAPEDKRLLQAAAVVGKDVPFPLLEAIAGEPEARLREALGRLQATEFLYEVRLFPELEYTFKHALTHEVAYGGLLHDRRRALHARVLDAMEKLYGERLDERVERLAYHAASGDVLEKAVRYLRQAGNKAAARSALQDARARYEQALGILETLPVSKSALEQGFEIRLELRTVLTQLTELRTALERLREAETISERLNDDHRRARICSVLMTLHTLLGETNEAVATGTRALEMAGRLGDLRLRILTTSYLEQAQYYRGEYAQVVDLAADALGILPADWAHEHFGMVAPASIYARSWLVISLAELGRFGEAAERADEAIRLAEATHHAYTIGLAHRAAGTFHLIKGDWAAARSLLEHGISVLRSGNVRLSLPPTMCGSALALARVGEASEALKRVEEAERDVAHHTTAGMRRAWDDHLLGRTYLLLGHPDKARELAGRAVDLLPSQPGAAAHALHLLGDIATYPDRSDAEPAETHYRKALALAQHRGMRPLIAQCHLGLGLLHRRTDRRPQAREHLALAATMYREMAMVFWLKQADTAIAAL